VTRFMYSGPSMIMPMRWPKNGIFEWTTGGSLGSTLTRRRLERNTTAAIASPIAPNIVLDIAMLAISCPESL
jgi:hypothetical protein